DLWDISARFVHRIYANYRRPMMNYRVKPSRRTKVIIANDFIHVAFARSDCSVCAHLSQCTSAKGRRRTVNIKPKELHEALQQNRQREKTKEFKEEYSKRAGVEGTISQGVRAFGLRRSRYIGIGKTHLQHLATAAAINLKRVSDWLAGGRS